MLLLPPVRSFWVIRRLFLSISWPLIAAALTIGFWSKHLHAEQPTPDVPTQKQSLTAGETSQFQSLTGADDFALWHASPHLHPEKYVAASEEQKKKWQQELRQHWTVQGDVIVNDGRGPYLVTNESYRDFELRLKYKTVARADSGIYLKGTPQVQIWDSTDEGKFSLGADKGSGGLWNNSKGAAGKDPIVKADAPFGEWNDVRIVQVGARTSVWLNEQIVVDHAIMENYWDRNSPLFPEGSIYLQTHGGEIQWKDILVRRLSTSEANRWLAERTGGKVFAPIFDGKTLTGWNGAVDDYAVIDGAIQCKPKRGGNLYTEEVFGDFIARLEFQLPAGGNNGLAIRFPGKGNPAYDGMTELQVLDNTAKKYAKLDKRQYHGSAYGISAAARGYLRPVGEWNFQEVTVQGSTIRVELNGNLILSTDVSKIDEYMANSAHPGKLLTEGHFGFAGHGDAVRFRGMQMHRIESTESKSSDQ